MGSINKSTIITSLCVLMVVVCSSLLGVGIEVGILLVVIWLILIFGAGVVIARENKLQTEKINAQTESMKMLVAERVWDISADFKCQYCKKTTNTRFHLGMCQFTCKNPKCKHVNDIFIQFITTATNE